MSIKNIVVPDIGSTAAVDVIEVLVKIGDKVEVDSPLIALESDKATMEIPSTEAGIVKEVKVKVGDKIQSGGVIITVETAEKASQGEESTTKTPEPRKETKKNNTVDENEVARKKEFTEKESEKQKKQEKPEKPEKEEAHPFPDESNVHAGPAVRKIAREFGVNLHQVNATGPKSRILMEDVQGYVKIRLNNATPSGAGLPAAPKVDFSQFGDTETRALSKIKKLTGKNLHRNWLLVPHVTQFGEADITELEAFRVSQKNGLEKQGIKITPLIFIMKAVVGALQKYPQFNASLDESGENLILKNYFHIGVAVDTPDGLVVPVIKDVNKKGVIDLAKELALISEKARNKKLMPNDMQGGCFSISSLGGIGGTAFTPIVNLPEVAILGVSKSTYKPVYQDGSFIPRLMLPLSLSYDHRVIDGADGARFINYLAEVLGDLRHLLM